MTLVTLDILNKDGVVINQQTAEESFAPYLFDGQTARLYALDGEPVDPATNIATFAAERKKRIAEYSGAQEADADTNAPIEEPETGEEHSS